MSEKPVVSVRVDHEVPCGTGKRRLVFTIGLDRCLNGYEGEQLSIEVPCDATPDAVAVLLAERTAWKVKQQTGITYGLKEVVVDVQAFVSEDGTPAASEEPPAPTEAAPEEVAANPSGWFKKRKKE